MTFGPSAAQADAGTARAPAAWAGGTRSLARSDAAIWTRGLTKSYGQRRAVDHLDLQVPRGALSGFVGPNGAGKSTTLRMLLGLLRPTAGRGHVLGEPIGRPDRYLHRVGAMIEGPTFHPGLSGRRNLDQLAILRGLGGRRGQLRRRVDEVLAQVGLGDRAQDPFASYSLGMKQRLGIAAALLPKPSLLILDEPTNGLDPAGIREIRALLGQLAGAGMTVFVSSHLLTEVEQICDHLVMLDRGRMLFQGHVTELLAAEDPRIHLVPEHDGDARQLARILDEAGLRVEIDMRIGPPDAVAAPEHRPVITVHAPEVLAADLNRLAMSAGIALRSLRAHRPNLEETFLRVTGEIDGDLSRADEVRPVSDGSVPPVGAGLGPAQSRGGAT
ncbi:ABC-type multidrug transport system, ATPase component [Frankia canadensis]|uniref:ABC-type multidrug transport system, ATPase component n=1 Tax=Frankia canadensis TaxID=1836972 RepID=A0A2I2KS94_9ACTN|nr:ATP-binding cassette domain-containing protein [Frankia canadensis]SNQ48543.1 ABC-type multidrug transport system, ATPase component [Frankia canadensis]SOU55833.1 ABC-type multidrug transport system, ATPase component [Frankia canadensis]